MNTAILSTGGVILYWVMDKSGYTHFCPLPFFIYPTTWISRQKTRLVTVHVVVVVVVVFTLKTVLTSIQYPSLSYSSRQRNEFPWSHANPK